MDPEGKETDTTSQTTYVRFYDSYVPPHRAPSALTTDYVKNTLGFKGSELPPHDMNTVTVPGAAAAWVDTVEKLGSGKLTLEEVLAPAIDLAENG